MSWNLDCTAIRVDQPSRHYSKDEAFELILSAFLCLECVCVRIQHGFVWWGGGGGGVRGSVSHIDWAFPLWWFIRHTRRGQLTGSQATLTFMFMIDTSPCTLLLRFTDPEMELCYI